MRKVNFPLQLDVSDLATDELRDQIRPINTALKQIVNSRDDRAKQAKRMRAKPDAETPSEDELRRREREEIEQLVSAGPSVAKGGNVSGLYELCAMVTHKGASADSGHYIGWTRKDDGEVKPIGEEEWFKFDDDKVSVVTADKILNMDGGGEDSVAYILLYRSVRP